MIARCCMRRQKLLGHVSYLEFNPFLEEIIKQNLKKKTKRLGSSLCQLWPFHLNYVEILSETKAKHEDKAWPEPFKTSRCKLLKCKDTERSAFPHPFQSSPKSLKLLATSLLRKVTENGSVASLHSTAVMTFILNILQWNLFFFKHAWMSCSVPSVTWTYIKEG